MHGAVHALPHDGGGLAEALDAVLPARIDAAWVASVASPAVSQVLADALARRTRSVVQVRTQAEACGVRIAYAQPQRLGVDRFLALLGAHRHHPGAALLCGVGTALTLDLLDAGGVHRGGRIAPSPTVMREALHGRASQLPVDGGVFSAASPFADDTGDALASGCEGAALALVHDSLQAARDLLGDVARAAPARRRRRCTGHAPAAGAAPAGPGDGRPGRVGGPGMGGPGMSGVQAGSATRPPRSIVARC